MEVAEFIFKVLKDRGIEVPDHHKEMLLGQWQAYSQLRERSELENLADDDIGLHHVPGGDRHGS